MYNNETEVQRVDRSDFYNIDKSKLTKPSTGFPVYLYESNFLYVKPTTITSGINVDFVKKPSDVIWGFTVGSLGQYINNAEVYNVSTQPTGSLNFELHVSEQTEVILKILLYAGIIIRDPQIVQAAAQQVQAEEINKKS